MLDEKYIENNVADLPIKFDRLTVESLVSGTDAIGENYKPINEQATLLKDNMPRFLWGLILSVFLTSFIWDFVAFGWISIVTVLIKLMGLTWNIYVGRTYGLLFPDTYLIPLSELRINELKKYLQWKKDNKKESE